MIRKDTRNNQVAWWLYVFFSTLCPNSILGKLSLLFFFVYSIFYCKGQIEKKWTPFLCFELLFLLYSGYQCMGIAVNTSAASRMCTTVGIGLLFDYALLRYLSSNSNSITRCLKTYINAVMWGILVTFVVYGYIFGGHSIFGFRLNSAYNVTFMGIPFMGHSATALAAIVSNAIIIEMMVYWKDDKRTAIKYLCFFAIIIIMTGSRKNLVYVALAAVVIPSIYSGNHKNKKKIIMLFFGVLGIFLVLFLLYKVPFLYEVIGKRVFAVLNHDSINMNEASFGESSMRTRRELREKAYNAFLMKPILGWGLNNFSAVINNGGYYAHNNFLEILVSSGIIGFCLYYSKYIVLLKNMVKIKKSIDKKAHALVRVSIVTYIVYIVLEWWQITYMFRFIYVLPILMLVYCQVSSPNDSSLNG